MLTNTWRNPRLIACAMGLAAVGLAGASAPAAVTTSAQTCAISLDPVQAGGTASRARTLGCWGSPAEAEAALGITALTTSGMVDGLAVAAAQTLIGRDYSAQGYAGSQQLWYASNSVGCSGGATYSYAMPASFNNATRSAQGYAGCAHNTHYDPPSASGANIVCAPACSTMGAMDLKTSYVRWAP